MKARKRVFTTATALVVLVVVLYFVTDAITAHTGYFVTADVLNEPSDFETCLTEQDITLYINSGDSKTTLQGSEALVYLDYVKIVNCFNNNQPCVEAGIGLFPTWVINENKIEENINIFKLSDLSNCRIK